jgi:hypothetical protein
LLTDTFPPYGRYLLLLVRARVISWFNLSNGEAEDSLTYLCIRKDCLDWCKGLNDLFLHLKFPFSISFAYGLGS